MHEENNGRWILRCEVNGRSFQIETAYPLPLCERSAAEIIARYDLRDVVSPRYAKLVWVSNTGEDMEVHPLIIS